MDECVIRVEDLRVHFHTAEGVVRAVNGVSLEVRRGETLAVVGESGSGKSVTALSILRLLPEPPARIESGQIRLGGRDLLTLTEAEMRRVRGNAVSMIFQEPMTSLDPVMTVGRQIAEAIETHQGLSRSAAMKAAVAALELVRVSEPARRAQQYPFQLSGGLRQRVMIAMAMACNPELLIADEPTTALDVTIQAQILNLMDELKERVGASIILITHDLGVVAEMAQRVVVMYAGRVVEQADVEDLFARPQHPYTLGLLGSVPRLYSSLEEGSADRRLQEIPGVVPSMREEIVGCPFAPRCRFAEERCRREAPTLEEKRPSHAAACWRSAELEVADA
jgi:peptide/nickel transport system ATP-binding protein